MAAGLAIGGTAFGLAAMFYFELKGLRWGEEWAFAVGIVVYVAAWVFYSWRFGSSDDE